MDVIHPLARLEFPESVRKALSEMTICLEHAFKQQTGIPGIGASHEDLAREIADRFVLFPSKNIRKHSTGRLNAMQELQVTEMVCAAFRSQKNSHIATAMFNTLFGNRECPLLMQKLVSISIAIGEKNVLDSSALWMKRQGLGSPQCSDLTRTIVNDYCLLVPKVSTALKQLPLVSAAFASHFVILCTELYSMKGPNNTPSSQPPETLLETITYWIMEDPLFCAPPKDPTTKYSPTSRTVGSFPGLVVWTLMTALTHQPNEPSTRQLLCSKLHLGLLQCLISAGNSDRKHTVLTFDDVCTFVGCIQRNMDDRDTALCLDRLGKLVQVALATGALQCNPDCLPPVLKELPQNRMIAILLAHHCTKVKG